MPDADLLALNILLLRHTVISVVHEHNRPDGTSVVGVLLTCPVLGDASAAGSEDVAYTSLSHPEFDSSVFDASHAAVSSRKRPGWNECESSGEDKQGDESSQGDLPSHYAPRHRFSLPLLLVASDGHHSRSLGPPQCLDHCRPRNPKTRRPYSRERAVLVAMSTSLFREEPLPVTVSRTPIETSTAAALPPWEPESSPWVRCGHHPHRCMDRPHGQHAGQPSLPAPPPSSDRP